MFKPVFVVAVLLFSLLATHAYASPVYVAKDSRLYHHDRNCSNLTTTTDLIEFASPQQADNNGALPCIHCESSTVKKHQTSSNHPADTNIDKSKLILGCWKTDNGEIEFFKDGTFMSYKAAREYKKKAGKWNINRNILTIKYYIHPKPDTYKILELSASTFKYAHVGINKKTYNGKRITNKQYQKILSEVKDGSNKNDKSKLILGCWKGKDGVIKYFKDGTFMLNTGVGKYKDEAGKWDINGNILNLRFYINPKLRKYKIKKLLASTYKLEVILIDRKTYNAKRITNKQYQKILSEIKDGETTGFVKHWFADETTGCKIWNSNPIPNESISWSGECVNGKAHGNGILIWYEDGIEASRSIFTAENGAVMINGFIATDVKSQDVTFKLDDCSKYSYRGVIGYIRKEIDLSNLTVANGILKSGALFAQKKCPKKHPEQNINVSLYQGGEKVIEARNYDDYELTWWEYRNNAYKKRLREEKERRWAEEKKIIEAKEALEAEMKKLEEEKKQEEIYNRSLKFVEKYGIQAWPSINELFANPFVYEGKTIAIIATFQMMQSATNGLFDRSGTPFVVSNIPKGIFTGNHNYFALAGKVLGNIEYNILGTNRHIPHLKFVGVHFCEKGDDCTFAGVVIE